MTVAANSPINVGETNRAFAFDAATITATTPNYGEVGTLILGGRTRRILCFEVGTATQNLGNFKLQLQDHPAGAFYDWLGGTDFDSVSGPMLECTTMGPHEVTAGNVAHVKVRVEGAYAVKFLAMASVSGAVVTIRGQAAKEH